MLTSKYFSALILGTAFTFSTVLATAADEASVSTEAAAFFETKIRPVLIDRCLDCHSGDEPENGLDLSTRKNMIRGGKLGTALSPGRPAESLMISAIRHDEFIKMPPKEKLPTAQVVDFTQWVKMGAPWPNSKSADPAHDGHSSQETTVAFSQEQLSHWSFQSLTDPPVPEVRSTWAMSPVDQFIDSRLVAAGLKSASPADKRTLIRRATFDLTGLPPTPAEVESFLQDKSANAFATVVDRLLASPRYGERWGRHWLDVARYADSNGLDENLSYANAYRYRDYVIAAFNSDKPYARFLREQIAGDLLPEVDDEAENMDRYIATGFLALGPKMLAEDDPVKMQMDIIDEQLSTLGQTFMGLTIGCARCHDHKFDPIPTQDYYSLAGIFKSTRTMENHKVVAVWYERPLLSKAMSAKMADLDIRIAATTAELEQFKSAQKERIAQQAQQRFASYLLATAALERLQSRATRQLAQDDNSAPFTVKDGFALFEAEAFHRGNVQKLFAGYGEGIGITGTSGAGFAEFDVSVERAGTYQLEIRYAAADSRPLKLFVNSELIEPAIAEQITGSWYPDGQRWHPAGTFEMKSGHNTIKLDSDRVHPHVDRLAIVYRGPDAWPFAMPRPATITQIAIQHDVNLQLVSIWQNFLRQIDEGNLPQFSSLKMWIELSKLSADGFHQRSQQLLTEAVPDTDGTPELVRRQLLAKKIRSLNDVADVYQRMLSNDAVKAELLQSPSPLAGPADVTPAILAADKRQALVSLQTRRDELVKSRPAFEVAMGVTEAEAADTRVHLRGSHIALGAVAPRRFPRVLSGGNLSAEVPGLASVPAPKIPAGSSGRLELAQWMTSPSHPLTWRVIVNRIWHWHFGRGLTPTVDNFGLLGQPPTHPQLLDWLTQRFIEGGGSIKSLHRLIMLSQTYQMSTQFDAKASGIDPDNKLLWRFRRRRLSGEEIRDSLLSLGTGLDEQTGGSLLKVKNRAYVTVSGSNIKDEYQNYRRSVYLPVVRSSVYDVLQTFDFPDPAVATGVRQTSTVAPQALMMMNSELVEEQTAAMAKRFITISTLPERVTTIFNELLHRAPTAEESAAALRYVRAAQLTPSLAEHTVEERTLRAWQSYCRVLISSNEFAYIE